MEVLEYDRQEALEKERLRLEELKENGELPTDSDLKSPTSETGKGTGAGNAKVNGGGESDDDEPERGPLSVGSGGGGFDQFDDDDDDLSQYSSVNSDQILNYDQKSKITNKLNELFSELLILFTHNMNLKDLAFQYEEYNFIA